MNDFKKFGPSTSPRWDCPGDRRFTNADVEFMTKARKRSPRFPSVAEALERRRMLREAICARLCMFACVVAFVYGLITNDTFAWIALTIFGVGFLATCWVAGSRRHRQMGGGSDGYPGA